MITKELLQQAIKETAEGNACVWSEDVDGNWDTQCGGCFVIEEGRPSENDMRYCCYCGKPLDEKLYQYDEDDVA